jgi:simple sugar transport system permease protein
VIITAFMLHRTRYGNWIYAAGGDAQAARAVGVPVNRVKISLFMISTCLACLLGILTVMTSGASDPKAGDFRELHAIAAAVIGGCALMGGYGSVIGAVLGALIFAIASRGINFVPFIDNNLFRVMLGFLVLGAALLNQFLRNRVLRG